MTPTKRKYDLIVKVKREGAYLVQPCRGVGYRPEFWLMAKHGTLVDTRRERFGTVLCEIGTFEMDPEFAKSKGLTDRDQTKEATVHELPAQK